MGDKAPFGEKSLGEGAGNNKVSPRTETLEQLNERHAVTMVGGQCLILNEEPDPLTGKRDVTFSRPADFKLRYKNQKVEVPAGKGTKLVCIADLWLDWEERRQYSGVIFQPGETPNGVFNLWGGFPVVPKAGDWHLFGDHISENICGADGALSEYVFDWMAHLVQNPGGPKAGTALVLRGERGTGKSVFADYFGRIFGRHYIAVSQQAHVVGRFNGHLKDKILLFGDESFFAGDRRDASVLKALITEPMRILEEKYMNPIPIKNHLNVILASNESWVVPAGMSERRFCLLDLSSRHKQDRQYFGALIEQMENGGVAAMMHDLLHRKITRDVGIIPRTNGLADQVTQSLDSVESFWFDALRSGQVPYLEKEDWPDRVPKSGEKGLWAAYIAYCKARNARHPESQEAFGRRIRRVCPGIKHGKMGFTGGDRPNAHVIPPLQECRKAMDEALGVPIRWETSENE